MIKNQTCSTLFSYLIVPDIEMLVPAMPDQTQFELLPTDPEDRRLFLEMTQPVVQAGDAVLGEGQVDAQLGADGDRGG